MEMADGDADHTNTKRTKDRGAVFKDLLELKATQGALRKK
jgi:hypothetical protein